MSKESRQLESLAARIVVSQTGGDAVQLDPGGGPEPLADFRLVDNRGVETGLLEVTSIVDSAAKALANGLHGPKDLVVRDMLGSNLYWVLSVDSNTARLSDLREAIPAILHALEVVFQRGHPDGSGWRVIAPYTRRHLTDNGLPEALNAKLHALNVLLVAAWPDTESPGRVEYTAVGSTWLRGPESVTVAVNAELHKADNLNKLRTAHQGHRAELFVWLEALDLRLEAEQARPGHPASVGLPSDAPTIPQGITAVWAAPTPKAGDRGLVWYSDGAVWSLRDWTVTP